MSDINDPITDKERSASQVEALLRERAGCVNRVVQNESASDELQVLGDDVGAIAHTRIAQRYRKQIIEIDKEIVYFGGEAPDDEYVSLLIAKKPAAKKPAAKKPAAAAEAGAEDDDEGNGTE